jgi:hypothetical protein
MQSGYLVEPKFTNGLYIDTVNKEKTNDEHSSERKRPFDF